MQNDSEFKRLSSKSEQSKQLISQHMETYSAILMEHLKILFPFSNETQEAVGALYHFQDKMREAIKTSEFPGLI